MTVHTTQTLTRPTRPGGSAPGPAVIAGTRPLPESSAGDVVLAYLRIQAQAARDLGVGAHLAGENAFTYGLLYENELHQAGQRDVAARRVWKRASRSRYRRWMN